MAKTLKKLKIWSCEKLTNEGILNIIVELPNLSYLNANTTTINNSVLDKCVELDRKIYICCNRTSINAKEFQRTHKNTSREVLTGNVYLYQCKNVKFEIFMNSIYNKNFNVAQQDASQVTNSNETWSKTWPLFFSILYFCFDQRWVFGCEWNSVNVSFIVIFFRHRMVQNVVYLVQCPFFLYECTAFFSNHVLFIQYHVPFKI